MPVRRYIKSLVLRSVEPSVRTWVDSARKDSIDAVTSLREELNARAPTAPQPDERLGKMQEEIDGLKKKLSMAMGAMQAASAQLVSLKQELEAAQNLANQAMQKAVSALSTAESANDGVTALEQAAANAPAAPAPAGQPSPQGQQGGKRNRQKRI